jgi:molybdopterin molybdotransferase
MKELISPTQARKIILKNTPSLPSEICPLNACAGRILREDIVADRPFPPFNRSMMDGYALRLSDSDSKRAFNIVAQAPAGASQKSLGHEPNSCVEIMTGAVVPADADCVVPYEAMHQLNDKQVQVCAPEQLGIGDNIHPLASDRAAGEVLLRSGRPIGAREIAVAASCGYSSLTVTQRPSIAIVSTGDELVNIQAAPAPHQIRRSNDIMVQVALQAINLPVSQIVHIPDDPACSHTQLEALIAQHDIVIVSGGISQGKSDFIPAALDALGLECKFHGVRQKPGKPLGFWSQPQCAVFTLPGNPLATLTCLHHYLIPTLNHAMKRSAPIRPRQVTLDVAVKASNDLTIYLPVSLNANNQASPQATNNSGDLVRILQSDGYIALPPNTEKNYKAGKRFDFHAWY